MVRALAFLLCGTLRCDSDLVPHQTCGLSLLLVLALLSGFPGLKKGPCDHLGQVGFVKYFYQASKFSFSLAKCPDSNSTKIETS